MSVEAGLLVVGGGIAGTATSGTAARNRRVILVEAESELGFHSTGRSAASFLPSYGGPVIRRLTLDSLVAFKSASTKLGVSLLASRPLLWVAGDAKGERHLDVLASQDDGLTVLSPGQVTGLCPVIRPGVMRGGILDERAADIEVASLHQWYLAQYRRNGVTIVRQAPLTSANYDGSRWHARCGSLHIVCDTIVDAAGAWADDVACKCGVAPLGLQPYRRSMFTSPVSPDLPAWRDGPLVLDAAETYYFRPEGEGQVLISPADMTPVEPHDARPDEMEIARALDAVNSVTSLAIRHVARSWAGLRTFAADRLPVVGPAHDNRAFIFVAGQGGYGIQTAPALACLAARVLGVADEPAGSPGDYDDLLPALVPRAPDRVASR